ncbi:hypothetical protein BC835DRAFT_27668 [Cytidiella melzeri]|nr:hypothetical protein BC835DRAFT_27668 [Cytidiella melzeri]
MRLDFDVLFEVLWWVRNKKTVSRLMRTCRTLYSKGVPLLLDSFVHLDNHRLQSFCLFMTADSSRCQYLRSVYFNFLALCHEPADIDAILGVIQNASNLKRLHLNNETLASDDRFPLAFASLSSVEELVLDTYGKAAADMLADLESPVRHADITFVAGRNQSFPNPTDFVEALQNASKTLKTVVVSNVHWEASTLGLKFPEVVSLTIENYDSIDGEGLMAALPKLRKLCTDHDFVGEDAQRLVINSLDEFQEMRSVSLERQECNGSSWESLDELSGNLHYLYCLGIACPTRKLELRVVEPLRLDWLERSR